MYLRRTRRRLFARLCAPMLLAVALGSLIAAPASAHDETGGHGSETDVPGPAPDGTTRLIVVLEVNGLIDPIMSSYIRRQITIAEGQHALGLVLQMDSAGSTLDDESLVNLLDNVRLAHLPVGIWVGPSGAQALGGAAHLVTTADFAAIAPGGRIGEFTAVQGLIHAHGPDEDRFHHHHDDGLHSGPEVRYFDADVAMGAGLTDSTAPTIGEFIFAFADAGYLPQIAQEVTGDDGVERRAPAPDVVVSFVSLPLIDGLFHTAASPAIAYLLLLAALSLLLLDFYTGGVGVAAAVGAVCGLLSAFGLGTLDIRLWALVLVVGAFVAFAIDIQAGAPRFWTAIGGVVLLVGSLRLFGEHSMSWIPLLVGIVGVGVFVLSGMPALVRTRYGTATVGREWMIGATGTALTDIDPDGTVEVHGAQWRARVNRLTPLQAGETLRVGGLSGVVLEVEPLEGAAVDYRELRRKVDDEQHVEAISET